MERRIIRKILGPRKTSEGWKLRSNDEIYQSIENITETMRKKDYYFLHIYIAVSYTHLDVYKRQILFTMFRQFFNLQSSSAL